MRIVLSFFVIVFGILIAGALIVRGFASLVPGSITSWYRTPAHNAEIGGLEGSMHLIGWAVDFVPANADVENSARQYFPIVVNEVNHIHASLLRA